MDDRHIIELFFSRSPQAAAEAAEKYGRYCRAIAGNILGGGQEAEACVRGAWQRAQEAMPPYRPSRLSAFLGGLTRDLALDRYDSRPVKKRGEGEVPLILMELEERIGQGGAGETPDGRAVAGTVAAYLRTQPLLCRMIFIRRYWYCNSVAVIARQLSCGEGRVESTLKRMGEALKRRLEEAGQLPVKSMAFLRAMGGLPEDLAAEGNLKRRHPLIRAAAVAACLLILLSALYPFFRDRLPGRGESLSAQSVTLRGAYYEIWEADSVQARRTGLPAAIPPEMVGMQIDEISEGSVHLYLPAEDQSAVYILKGEEGLRYLILAGCPLPGDGGSTHVDAQQMFLTYGVTRAEELASVTWQEEAITDAGTLSALYDGLVSAESFGEGELEPGVTDYGDPVWLEGTNGLRWMAYYHESGLFYWLGSCYSVGEGFLPAPAA